MASKLAQMLKQWMVEMGIEDCDDLMLECQRLAVPELESIWHYIVTHVRPREEVRRIKTVLLHQNLTKQGGTCNETIKNLSSEEMDRLRRYNSLKEKIRQQDEEIKELSESINKMVLNFEGVTSPRNENNNAKKRFYELLVNSKKQNMHRQLKHLIDLVERLQRALKVIGEDSSVSSAHVEKILQGCMQEIGSYFADLHSQRPVSSIVPEKITENVKNKFAGIPSEHVLNIVIKKMRESVTKIENLKKDVLKNCLQHTDNEENVAKLKQELQQQQLNQYMQNKNDKAEIEKLVRDVKEKQELLYTIFLERNAGIKRADYDQWCTLSLKSHYLNSVKQYLVENAVMEENGDLKTPVIEKSLDIQSMVKRYKDIVDRDTRSLEVLGKKILFNLANISSKHLDETLNTHQRFTQFDDEKQEGHSKCYAQVLKDCVLKEFQETFKIPYEGLDFQEKRNHLPEISVECIGSIVKMCCWLQMVMMSDVRNDTNAAISTYDVETIKTKITEVARSEKSFEDGAKALMDTTEQNLPIVENHISECEELYNFHNNPGHFVKYIPEKLLVKEESFKAWLDKVDSLISHLKRLGDNEQDN